MNYYRDNKNDNDNKNDENINGEQKPKSSVLAFIKKRGFYIAIILCVLAAAGISYSAVSGMLDKLNPQNGLQEEDIWEPQTEQDTQVIDPYESLPVLPSQQEQPGSSSNSSDTPASSEVSDVSLTPVYILPVKGEVTNAFSGETLVKSATMSDWRTHNGIDFAAVEGTEAYAVYSGEVTFAGEDPLWGLAVELKLDSGYTVFYAGLKTIQDVEIGQIVSQGDVIGTVGSSSIIEKGEGPHLHFEVRLSGGYIDPAEILPLA